MKARLLAVLLVSSLVLAAAAPLAFAQVTVSGDNNASQYVDCSQVQNAVQNQYGDQNAAANDNSEASIANELNITQEQVNACLGEPGDGGGGGGNGSGSGGGTATEARTCADFDTRVEAQAAFDDDPSGLSGLDPDKDDEACEDFKYDARSTPATKADVIDETIPKVASLPNTGGPSLLALGAGLALVAGAASLIRIRR